MMPLFKHPESMLALGRLKGSNIVKKSLFPSYVVEDLMRFDRGYFFVKKKHLLVFED